MDLAGLLPERSAQDVLSGRIRLSLGGQPYVLPVRSIAANREWKEQWDSTVGARIADIPDDKPGEMFVALGEGADDLLTLLISYDHTGVLPSREALEQVATPPELLIGILEVWAAANPLLGMALVDARGPRKPKGRSQRTSGSAPRTRDSRRPVALKAS